MQCHWQLDLTWSNCLNTFNWHQLLWLKTSTLIWKYGTSIIAHTELQTALIKFEQASNLRFTQGILFWPNDINNRWLETWLMWVVTEDFICIIWLKVMTVLRTSIIALDTKLVSVFSPNSLTWKEKVRKRVRRLTFWIRNSTFWNRNGKSYTEQLDKIVVYFIFICSY